jgi:hypothetical protein
VPGVTDNQTIPDELFIGISNDAPQLAPPDLGYDTAAGGPGFSSWQRHWNLSYPASVPGQIVQQVTIRDTVGSVTKEYWEAWPIDAGAKATKAGDDLEHEGDRMTKYQSRFCFVMIAAMFSCSLSDLACANGGFTGQGQLTEIMTKVRDGQTATVRHEAAEELEHLARGIDPETIDDRTLSEIAGLLNAPEEGVRVWLALALGHFGPRAREIAAPKLISLLPEVDCILGDTPSAQNIRSALKNMGVTPPPPPPECEPDYRLEQAMGDSTPRGQLIEMMVKVRLGQTAASRTEAAQQLAQLTRKIGSEKVDDRTLLELVALLYTSDDSVRGWVATALGNLGPRAREAAALMLIRLLPEIDCLRGGLASAPMIRAALKNMGVTPPPPPAKCER